MPGRTLPTVIPFNATHEPKLGAEVQDVDLNDLTGMCPRITALGVCADVTYSR